MNSFSAQKLRQDVVRSSPWTPAEMAGRLMEISGFGATAALTIAFGLVLEAQQRGDLVSWITAHDEFFYPPDVAQGGVDLDALVVVRLSHARALPRAGEKLLRSGAFALIVLDIGRADIPTSVQVRLAGLARQHHTALICLTEKENGKPSLGSLISLRVHAQRIESTQGQFVCNLKVLKDKRRGPTWNHEEVFSWPTIRT